MITITPPDFIPRQTCKLDAPRKALVRVDHHPGIVLHCTGGVRPTSVQQAMRRWVICQDYHRSKGWSDIGYHFGVTPDGYVLVGRGFDVLGAHAKGHNRWLGVVVLGRGEEMTEAEQRAIAWLYDVHRDRGGGVAVIPHNAISRKKCPGPAVTAWARNQWPGGAG